MTWLPSDREWIEDVAGLVFDGAILLTRGLPRSGKTSLAKAVADELGESAIFVSGRDFDEKSQVARREELRRTVVDTVARCGVAQVVFDDYGRAIRRSGGGALHSMLYGLLVDGPVAQDVGALLTSRFGDDLTLRFSGSPLLSRARTISQPVLQEKDAESLGLSWGDLIRLIGTATSLARRLDAASSSTRAYQVVEYLKADAHAISNDLPTSAIEVLLGAKDHREADNFAQQALLSLGSLNEEGVFEFAQVVEESELCAEVQVRAPGWPASPTGSVEQFAEMLAGAEYAYWVDRYMCADPAALRAFLLGLRKRTGARLRLLTCEDRDVLRFVDRVRDEVASIDDVEVRLMKYYDRADLHDRHLALPAFGTGFVLPTAGVITGRDAPGSAIAVRMPALPVDYSEYWKRATPVA